MLKYSKDGISVVLTLDSRREKKDGKYPVKIHETARDTALFYSLSGCCKPAGVNPYDWLLDILQRIKDCKTCNLHLLLPIHWRKSK
jgi:hypothetical protein